MFEFEPLACASSSYVAIASAAVNNRSVSTWNRNCWIGHGQPEFFRFELQVCHDGDYELDARASGFGALNHSLALRARKGIEIDFGASADRDAVESEQR